MAATFKSIGVSRLRMLNDGEGVTTLVAGYGCPLRCRYCLNPQCFIGKPVKEYCVQELIDEVKIDDLYFQATGGGIVFGGGEPLLQAEFIKEFCEKCPSEWKISLESSAAVPLYKLEMVAGKIDFFLIDIKDMNPHIYEEYTGKNNENVINNLRFLSEHADTSKICIRLPLIPEFNTDEDRNYSENLLCSMGFTRFDRFEYIKERSVSKRKEIEKRISRN